MLHVPVKVASVISLSLGFRGNLHPVRSMRKVAPRLKPTRRRCTFPGICHPARAHGFSFMTAYRHPDFTQARFVQAPQVRWAPAPRDGVLPERFFSTTNLPTYVKIGSEWRLPRDPRMDSAVVLDPDGIPRIVEGRYVTEGQAVALGLAEDGAEGIYVHA